MFSEVAKNIRLALVTFVLFGVIYSLAVLGVSQLAFPFQANGSLVSRGGTVAGSTLIGQNVTSTALFHGRPSATVNPTTGKPEPYAANNSGGSNLGPTSPALLAELKANEAAIRPWIPLGPIPLNLLESSASGLDPEITVPDALLQVPVVSQRTGIPSATLIALIHHLTEAPLWGLYGPPRVNVFLLNQAVLNLSWKAHP